MPLFLSRNYFSAYNANVNKLKGEQYGRREKRRRRH